MDAQLFAKLKPILFVLLLKLNVQGVEVEYDQLLELLKPVMTVI